ncbi:pyrimidine-nucleoside phosphorylase [Helcococcus kunzii]|uniref:pyrimidine-nucleoside phosphorylase n=1 Tax=Helcococcus kunzii TaxID=40091 RepID=UPI001C93A356|nr:pyrimidine-nucleoside phosphorylase [Helcococcus kunzii]QZO76529.1 pyrimidine-nucleoside phosphorylase [Helcococcus kunzii]
MRMLDIIEKKKHGIELNPEEIKFFINGFVNEEIPDYQVSALLMAIYFKGMTERETLEFTLAVRDSGDVVDLSSIKGIKVDKHSTGGVGDKTTLVIAPIIASLGAKIAKMSGRGLGHTGGTIDKMESIPGLKTDIPADKFIDMVNEIGVSVIGQTGNLAPADKKLYALRDVTATVDSIPLIAGSIMSKKLAAGSDAILLDVKTGSGAFMKTLDDAIELAQEMVNIGENAGKKTIALITEMDIPLGYNIGNTLEIMEVIETLKGHGPKDLTDVCIELASNLAYMAEIDTLENCKTRVKEVIENGKAFETFVKFVEAQGGDISYIQDVNKFEKAKFEHEVKIKSSGYVYEMETEKIGISSVLLGAGRKIKEDAIDFAAGIKLVKKTGDEVKENDTIAILYTNNESAIKEAETLLLEAYTLSNEKPELEPLILARVSKDDVVKY